MVGGSLFSHIGVYWLATFDRYGIELVFRSSFYWQAASLHLLAAAFRLDWIITLEKDQQVLLFTIGQMVGNLLLLAAMLLFARHVLLDAQGLLPSRKSKNELALEEEEDEDVDVDVEDEEVSATFDDQWKKIDSPHGTPQPVFQRMASPPPVVAAATTPPLNRKLTKGEKKALKAKLLRERRGT